MAHSLLTVRQWYEWLRTTEPLLHPHPTAVRRPCVCMGRGAAEAPRAGPSHSRARAEAAGGSEVLRAAVGAGGQWVRDTFRTPCYNALTRLRQHRRGNYRKAGHRAPRKAAREHGRGCECEGLEAVGHARHRACEEGGARQDGTRARDTHELRRGRGVRPREAGRA
jgi:hypothetical protein